MKLLTRSFWTSTLESVLAGFGSGFLGSWGISDRLNAHDLEAAAVAGGALALYTFIKAVAAVQSANAVLAKAAPKS